MDTNFYLDRWIPISFRRAYVQVTLCFGGFCNTCVFYRYWEERKRRVRRDSIIEEFVPFPGWVAQAERESLEYAGRHAIQLRRRGAIGACKAIYKKNANKAALWCLKQQHWVNRVGVRLEGVRLEGVRREGVRRPKYF